MSRIRILIADDHPIFRDGLRKLLEAERDFDVVGEAADGHAAIDGVNQFSPDVLLLDVAMPRLNGLEVLRALACTETPPRSILLTDAIEPHEIRTAFQLGARGLVMKTSATAHLFSAIRTVMAGEYWVGRTHVAALLQNLQGPEPQPEPAKVRTLLTQREREIVAEIVEGATNREIATSLGLSEQTVKNHLSAIFDKLGVYSRLELALYALNHHLIEEQPVGQRVAR